MPLLTPAPPALRDRVTWERNFRPDPEGTGLMGRRLIYTEHLMPDFQRPIPQIDYAHPDTSPSRKRRSIWVVPALAVLLVLLSAWIILPSFDTHRVLAPRAKCANNLRQIGLACLMYADDHSNQYPDSLSTVLRDEDITADVFVCPSSNDTPARGPTTQCSSLTLLPAAICLTSTSARD